MTDDRRHDLPSSTTGTQLHVFVWCNSGSGPRYLVCASLGFMETRSFLNEHGVVPTPPAKCRTFFPIRAGGPSRLLRLRQILIATWPHKQKSFRIDCGPIPSVADLTTAANSDSPLLRSRTPIVLDHAFTKWPLHIATPPTVDLLVEWHPAKFASPNTSILLSNWAHGHLQVIRWYFDCVSCNSLVGSEVLCTW